MAHAIAVMNTKGGVGKSTIVMALAETLSVYYRKKVLVIDSDSQTSMSVMLMPTDRWEACEQAQHTLADYLAARVISDAEVDWSEFVAARVSDVDEADTVSLIPSHMELALLEREISAAGRQDRLQEAVRELLVAAKTAFDIVLVDCPPGISILSEAWLRGADFHLPPLRPDYLSVRGYGILTRFRAARPDLPFSENIGLLVNMKDARIKSEDAWHQRLRADPSLACFEQAIPRRAYLQNAADFDPGTRTYAAKYPGDSGLAIRYVTQEILARLARHEAAARAAAAKPETRKPAAAPPPLPPTTGKAPQTPAAVPPAPPLARA